VKERQGVEREYLVFFSTCRRRQVAMGLRLLFFFFFFYFGLSLLGIWKDKSF
jgi:hypothetical protein